MGTSLYGPIQRAFCRVCTEFNSVEISGWVQSLACFSHTPTHVETTLSHAQLFSRVGILAMRHQLSHQLTSERVSGNLLKHYKECHPGCTPPERYLMKMQDCEGETLDLGQQMDRLDEMTMASLDSSNMDGWSESASMDAEDMETLVSRDAGRGMAQGQGKAVGRASD